MTKDDVIRMAREAGLIGLHEPSEKWIKEFSSFAALVEDAATSAANARANTSWALMCEKMVAAEREACAKVCEEPGWNAANWCAKAIRARSET